MKLAQALTQRADMEKRMKHLQTRITASARYTEGEEPLENAPELLEEHMQILAEREVLIARIHRTNASKVIEVPGVPVSVTITDAICLRDRLHAEQKFLNEMADSAGGHRDHYYGGRRRSELPLKTDLAIRDLRQRADRAGKRYREVDSAIQAANWEAELL